VVRFGIQWIEQVVFKAYKSVCQSCQALRHLSVLSLNARFWPLCHLCRELAPVPRASESLACPSLCLCGRAAVAVLFVRSPDMFIIQAHSSGCHSWCLQDCTGFTDTADLFVIPGNSCAPCQTPVVCLVILRLFYDSGLL
jgi:hypothetical protein